jgi:hypothetical protein
MPIELTLADAYLSVRMYGVVTSQDFVRYAQESEELELQQPRSLDRITDLTGVEHFEVHYEDVFQLADRRRRQVHTRPVMSAIIAREPVQIGMARMFQTVGDHEFIHVQVVRSLPEALDWISHALHPAVEN